ncbi:glutaminyl-peptide cyclotransferase [Acrasis kona]|uniref:Glutaminyl-peptide cyclotransferase n=1 Tax=Acrasis kona TaxID=1008807 RepID=A0AAW2ZLU2_9EUKA
MKKRAQKVRSNGNKTNAKKMNNDVEDADYDEKELSTNTDKSETRFLDTKQQEPFPKTRMFLIAIVVLLIVLLFVLSVILFGLTVRAKEKLSRMSYNSSSIIPTLQQYTKEIVSYTPRYPGYPGGIATQKMIARIFSQSENWNLEYDTFFETAPILGRLNFTNVIASYNGESKRSNSRNKKTLVIAAHYDSKYQKTPNAFQGATDSAVPCAMMLQMAAAFESMLDSYNNIPNYDLKFIFFDGEEAVKEWVGNDNTYGSRHLASLWEKQNKLSSIDLFVLLDLIGTKDVQFPNFDIHRTITNSEGYKRYEQLENIEMKLKSQNSLKTTKRYFNGVTDNGQISDDHMHFSVRGVPVLHLISYPFPKVWHTPNDNYEALDWDSIHDIQTILIDFLRAHMFNK